MSKAVTKGAHWLPRASQFSLHGQRNGRVDVLPPSAKDEIFPPNEERRKSLIAELHAAQAAQAAAIKESLALNPIRNQYGKKVAGARIGFTPPKPSVLTAAEERCATARTRVRTAEAMLRQFNAYISPDGRGYKAWTFEQRFIQAAQVLLSEQTFELLEQEARRLMAGDRWQPLNGSHPSASVPTEKP